MRRAYVPLGKATVAGEINKIKKKENLPAKSNEPIGGFSLAIYYIL